MTRLWEANHPYYCEDHNYYASGYTQTVFTHESWADYIEEFDLSHTDMDYNLVFRWDWKVPDPDDYDTEGEFGEPEPVPTQEHLHLYHMAQRKGAFWTHIVKVNREDEPAIREYLSAYAEHMKKIWEPLL